MRLALTLALAASIAAAQAGTIVVLNKSDDTVSLVDRKTGAVRATVPTGEQPHEVIVTRDGKTAYVTDYGNRARPGNSVTVIDVVAGKVKATWSHEELLRPHGIVLSPGERWLYVTSEGRRTMVALDTATGKVSGTWPTKANASHMVDVSPQSGRAFVANIQSASVTALDLERGTWIANVKTGRGAEGIAVTPDGAEVWISNRAQDTLSVVDARSLAVKQTIELETGGFPIRVKITPDGRRALVSLARAGKVLVLSTADRKVTAEIPIKERAVTDTTKRLFGDSMGKSPIPIGILIPPDGKEAFVACAQADRVAVIDLATLKITRTLDTGQEPDGLGWAPAPQGR